MPLYICSAGIQLLTLVRGKRKSKRLVFKKRNQCAFDFDHPILAVFERLQRCDTPPAHFKDIARIFSACGKLVHFRLIAVRADTARINLAANLRVAHPLRAFPLLDSAPDVKAENNDNGCDEDRRKYSEEDFHECAPSRRLTRTR